MQSKKRHLIFIAIIFLGLAPTWAQVDQDVNDRIAQYKVDTYIDFDNWPKEGIIIQTAPDISDIIASFVTNASFLIDHVSSELMGTKYKRDIYRAWREINGQKEELSIWSTIMETEQEAHEFLLSRWANVSTPFIKHIRGRDIGLVAGNVCFVIPHRSQGIQVTWVIRANTLVEINANGGLVMQTSNLTHVVDGTIKEIIKEIPTLPAQVRLKPEALEVNPGILTAFVRLPEGYAVSNITYATCDGTSAEKMILSDDQAEMVIKFRRKAIEAALAWSGEKIDTNFVIAGIWQNAGQTNFFRGTASIKKIVGAKSK